MKNFVLLLFMFGSSAQALPPVIFGPEFTFSDLQSNDMGRALATIQRMDRHLVEKQPPGSEFSRVRVDRKEFFTSPNGWWFAAHVEGVVDFQGVALEVITKPGTVEYFRQFKTDMQDAIFVSAANEELFPAMFRGGGHINLSMDTFKGNDLLLRNFIVDLMNHNELFMGVLGYDTHNAIPFQLNSKKAISEVYKVIQDFDDGFYASHGQKSFLAHLMRARDMQLDQFWKSWELSLTRQSKYFDVGLASVFMQKRIELRGVRPQASMDMWIRQIDLIEHRLRFLETIKTPIPIAVKVPLDEIDMKIHRLNPPIDAQLALQAFYEYIRESGLRWQDHTDYLWPKWVSDGEVAKFQKSQWFLEQENQSLCVRNLEVAG